jgi:feruloyl esterase
MYHCGGGPGLNSFAALTALENWIELGPLPDAIIASTWHWHTADPAALLVSQRGVYDGKGDPNSAASFRYKERGLGYC